MNNMLLLPRTSARPGVITLALLALLLAVGCDSGSFIPDTPPAESTNEPLPPNIRLRISYDQRQVTYSSLLPPGLIGDIDRGRANLQVHGDIENRGVMESYEITHETISYDEEGYLTRTYTYTDGWQGLNMPEAVYNDLKDQMPRRAPKNPVVKFKLEGGTMQFIRKDGQIAASASVDPSVYRVDPATLDSLEALRRDTSQTEQRETQMRKRLQRRGLALKTLSAHHVAFETRSKERGLSSIRRVIDLRTGQPVYLVYRKDDGRPARTETRTYGRYSGVPVMTHEMSYEYGDKNGQWTVVSRTETMRNNISVQFN